MPSFYNTYAADIEQVKATAPRFSSSTAFQSWCKLHTTVLPDEFWAGVRFGADKPLAEKFIADLAFSGSPVPIARDDYPTVGHLDATQVKQKLAEFRALDLEALGDFDREVLPEYGSWLEEAAARNFGLICFCMS